MMSCYRPVCVPKFAISKGRRVVALHEANNAPRKFNSDASFATFAAIRRTSSLVSSLAAEPPARPILEIVGRSAAFPLQVTKPAPPRESRRPIDTFFSSLAEEQGENAVSIVLSGTGSDGALG
jgi:CheB methylesterase